MASFRKRNMRVDRAPTIEGTRTSPQTGQVITSTGNISLDLVLGGGLPIGSICLIEEDRSISHSKLLAKYFLAEGIVSKHSLFLGSLDDEPIDFFGKLPTPIEETDEQKDAEAKKRLLGESPDKSLRIAWRYNNLLSVDEKQNTNDLGHHFDVTKPMDYFHFIGRKPMYYIWSNNPEYDNEYEDNTLKKSEKLNFDYSDSETESTHSNVDIEKSELLKDSLSNNDSYNRSIDIEIENKIFHQDSYAKLLKKIHDHLKNNKFEMENHENWRTLYRVCITSLASPQWFGDNYDKDLLKFLTILKSIIRSTGSVCLITMPMFLVNSYDKTLVPKIRNLVDYSIELESFAGSECETIPAFKKLHGLVHLRKVSAVNTLSTFMPETTDLGFKLKRKRFIIEKLHLPPELQENESGTSDDEITDMLKNRLNDHGCDVRF